MPASKCMPPPRAPQVLVSIVLWGFTGYHLSLICVGLTTKEHLKGRRGEGAPPRTLYQCLCACRCGDALCGPSALEPRKFVFLRDGVRPTAAPCGTTQCACQTQSRTKALPPEGPAP